MNFLDLKAGETIEVGTQKACRFWRYVFPPHHAPVRLLSWVSDTRWHPRQFVEGTTPDEGEQGIHGFKTTDDLLQSFSREPEHLVIRSQISGTHHALRRPADTGFTFGQCGDSIYRDEENNLRQLLPSGCHSTTHPLKRYFVRTKEVLQPIMDATVLGYS